MTEFISDLDEVIVASSGKMAKLVVLDGGRCSVSKLYNIGVKKLH